MHPLTANLVLLSQFFNLASWLGMSIAAPSVDTLPSTLQVFVGGEGNGGKDVTVLVYDTVKNTFTPKATSNALGDNVIWLQFDKTQKTLLGASAAKFNNKDKTGGVFSAAVGADGSLKKLSSSQTAEVPVSLEIAPDGKLVMVPSFNGGKLETFTLADGKLSKEPKQTFKFEGSGPVKERQANAAAHQAQLDPSGTMLLVPDLGTDKVHFFSLAQDTLTPQPDIPTEAGCGPRHLVFSPEKAKNQLFYLVCELSSKVLVMELTDKKATIKQKVSILPAGVANPKTMNAAEIAITPDGKFLYTSNRQKDKAASAKENIISVFSREEAGTLKAAGTFFSGGKGPRHFSFSPDKAASLVIVANQDSNLVCVHKRDPATGGLTQVAQTEVKGPAIALFKT